MKYIIVLLISLFIGILIISIGIGAAVPSINRIAKPIACPSGDLIVEKNVYRPWPGKTVISVDWYCIDTHSGTKEKMNVFQIGLYAGTIYGLIIFAVMIVLMLIRKARSASR